MQLPAGLNILLVEDEALIALDVAQLLADAGCRLVSCRDVVSAMGALVSEKIDAAILDVNLGHEHSLHLADEMEERAVPFVFLSGYDAELLPARYHERPFVTKPFAPEELFAALLRAIASAGEGKR